MSNPASLLGPARDRVSHGDIAVHDHVCGVYDSREDEYEHACRFIKIGIEQKNQCLYVAESLEPAEFLSRLQTHGAKVKEAVANGSLVVISGKELRDKLGGFTPEAMLSFLAETEQVALKSGYTALRLCADMMWLRQDNIEPGEFFRYEATLNQLFSEREIVASCQYSIDDFRSELLIAAIETHPLLVYDAIVCNNYYYIPPEEYLKPQFADMKLRRMLFNMVSRERMMHEALAH